MTPGANRELKLAGYGGDGYDKQLKVESGVDILIQDPPAYRLRQQNHINLGANQSWY